MALIGKEVFKIFKELSKDSKLAGMIMDKNFEKGSLKHELESWEMRNYLEVGPLVNAITLDNSRFDRR